MQFLEEIIPMRDLQSSFKIAVKKWDSTFPLNAFNVKNGYEQLVLEREQKRNEMIANVNSNRCSYYNHDTKTGVMTVVNPFNFDEEISLPCGYCRPSEYAEARRNFINTSGEIKPLDILNNVIDADFGKNN